MPNVEISFTEDEIDCLIWHTNGNCGCHTIRAKLSSAKERVHLEKIVCGKTDGVIAAGYTWSCHQPLGHAGACVFTMDQD